MTTVTLNINGEVRKLKIDGSTPLLWVLRDELKLTGTKYGCGRGLCGACTVHINGEATRSCVTSVESVNEEEINEALEIKSLLLKSIDEMELSVRSHNCLQAAGIETIGELVSKEESEMLKYKNFGRKSLTELGEKLDQLGLKFGMDISSYIEE